MQHEDERFENYLREFEPRRPQPLSVAITRRLQWRRLAAAAAILVALATSTWISFQRRQLRVALRIVTKPEHPSDRVSFAKPPLLQLTRMAVEDPRKLDAELTEESRRILPDFRSKESTLRVLAKE